MAARDRESEEAAENLPWPLQMEQQVNPLERDHDLAVVLPGGLEKNATVHGSKPVMDVLVSLCASYRLNPSDYTVEVLSANKNNISFKPNAPIGSLEAEKIVLKPKGVEEKIRRLYTPEASVRLLVNYNKAHKTVVRVSPTVPLETLLPVICDKCEFGVRTTVLLGHPGSDQLLDTSKTLNELGLRELFARDTEAREPVDRSPAETPDAAALTPTQVVVAPPAEELPKAERKPKKNAGFLSLFRKGKKKAELEGALSAPVSPSLGKPASAGANGRVTSCSQGPADMRKKRRAPPPPVAASRSVPADLGACHQQESTLRRTKRQAPPPPPPRADPNQEMQTSSEAEDPLSTLEEHQDSDESVSIHLAPSPPRASPEPRHLRFSSSSTLSSLHDMVDPYLPSFGGKDLSDARSALAKVLTSSLSRGALVRRLKNSAAGPKPGNGSTSTPGPHGCLDDGGVWTRPESVPSCSLPTQPEWEEPVHRVAMTTFKVVPSKPAGSDPAPVVLDQTEVGEGSADPETDSQTKTQDPLGRSSLEACSLEDPASGGLPSHPPSPDSESHVCPDSPPTEEEEEEEEDEPEVIPAESPECDDGEALTEEQVDPQSPKQSGSTDVDRGGPSPGETDVEGDVLQDEAADEEVVVEDAFPPPPSPVFFTEDGIILNETEEVPQEPSRPTSTSTGPGRALGTDLHTAPQPPEPPPEPLEKTGAAPSRFAEAVAVAVHKSRLQRQGKVLGPQAPSGPPSDLTSPFYV